MTFPTEVISGRIELCNTTLTLKKHLAISQLMRFKLYCNNTSPRNISIDSAFVKHFSVKQFSWKKHEIHGEKEKSSKLAQSSKSEIFF